MLTDAIASSPTLLARRMADEALRVSYRMCNVFVFDGDRLVCERLYFDLLTPLRQLGVARDPLSIGGRVATVLNHPLTVITAALRSLVR